MSLSLIEIIYFMEYFIIIPIAPYRRFSQDFIFLVSIYYKAETKICVFLCKSVCVRAHAQIKRPTTLVQRFGTEILESVYKKASKKFFF